MASVPRSARASLIGQHGWKLLELKSNKDLHGRAYSAHLLAKELAGVGLFNSAMNAVRSVNNFRTANTIITLATTSETIAKEMHKAGCSKPRVCEAFILELKFARDIMDLPVQSFVAESICREMLKAGFSQLEIEAAFKRAGCQNIYDENKLKDFRLVEINGHSV